VAIDRETPVSAHYYVPVLDALYRFGAGVDTNDKKLLETAFSKDAVVDFSPCGRKMGIDFSSLTGVETIVQFLGASAITQITSHVITNGRVQLTGNAAKLQALVDATHILRRDDSQRCQMRNWYAAELVEVEDRWRIRRLTIDSIWFNGDPQVLLGN
jgi:hypothetical protein